MTEHPFAAVPPECYRYSTSALEAATAEHGPGPCPGCEVCELASELIEEREAHAKTAAALEAAETQRDTLARFITETLDNDETWRSQAREVLRRVATLAEVTLPEAQE
jgi:hypothetical protein